MKTDFELDLQFGAVRLICFGTRLGIQPRALCTQHCIMKTDFDLCLQCISLCINRFWDTFACSEKMQCNNKFCAPRTVNSELCVLCCINWFWNTWVLFETRFWNTIMNSVRRVQYNENRFRIGFAIRSRTSYLFRNETLNTIKCLHPIMNFVRRVQYNENRFRIGFAIRSRTSYLFRNETWNTIEFFAPSTVLWKQNSISVCNSYLHVSWCINRFRDTFACSEKIQ